MYPDDAHQIARTSCENCRTGFLASTWMDENQALFRALHMEKLVTAIFIGLITFVAGLNILVVLSMTVTDKARDIAVLMSLGTRREQIRKIFLWQGITIGAVGNDRRLMHRLRMRVCGRHLSFNSARSPGVCGAVCSVSPWDYGWSVDYIDRHGHFFGCDHLACASRSKTAAGGDPAL